MRRLPLMKLSQCESSSIRTSRGGTPEGSELLQRLLVFGFSVEIHCKRKRAPGLFASPARVFHLDAPNSGGNSLRAESYEQEPL